MTTQDILFSGRRNNHNQPRTWNKKPDNKAGLGLIIKSLLFLPGLLIIRSSFVPKINKFSSIKMSEAVKYENIKV